MAEVQRRTWATTSGVPGGGESVPDIDVVTRAWERAVMVPPSERHSVWVATDNDAVVGLAALAPTSDPDLDVASTSELLLLAVDPDSRTHGHGSRLLSATMQSVSESGVPVAVAWVIGGDDQARAFLESAGWAPDGAHRVLAQSDDDAPADRMGQIRMATDLTPAPDLP
jgi:N-acetylglutamate synthase-like GNAT family acetyltransferase